MHNLSGQSIQIAMRNLESVAQKMTELLHNYVIFDRHFVFGGHIFFIFRKNKHQGITWQFFEIDFYGSSYGLSQQIMQNKFCN